MLVNRGELSPDPVNPARRRELEELRRAAAARRATQTQAPPAPEGLSELRQRALVAQRYVARAQAVLGGLEGFRDYLLAGQSQGEQQALEVILRARYQAEPVLDTHRETLLGIAARGDLPLLERWIATVRETVAGVAGDLDRRQAGAPGADSLQRLLEGIRRSGAGLEKLERENVLKLLG
jgi:hypothetical protein